MYYIRYNMIYLLLKIHFFRIEYEHTATLEYDSSVVVIGHNNFMAQVTNARMIIRLYVGEG